MIIKSAAGDDLARIEDMERDLSRKHKVGRKSLYAILRHADFHATYQDPPEHWMPAAYSAFSGVLLTHKLGFEQLKSLHSDFNVQRLLMSASWSAVASGELSEKPFNRAYRDHAAIAHRYACAVANEYTLHPDLLGRLTAEEFEQFNTYLEYVSSRCRIPAGKYVRQACARHLRDLERSHRSSRPEGLAPGAYALN
jgi:hypothetical protein